MEIPLCVCCLRFLLLNEHFHLCQMIFTREVPFDLLSTFKIPIVTLLDKYLLVWVGILTQVRGLRVVGAHKALAVGLKLPWVRGMTELISATNSALAGPTAAVEERGYTLSSALAVLFPLFY